MHLHYLIQNINTNVSTDELFIYLLLITSLSIHIIIQYIMIKIIIMLFIHMFYKERHNFYANLVSIKI